MIHSIIRHIESLPISPLGIIISRAMSARQLFAKNKHEHREKKTRFTESWNTIESLKT